MATEKKTPESSDPPPAPPALWATPIVMKREKSRKKRKQKYSRGTKGLQRLVLGFAEAGSRVAGGANRSAKNWVRRGKRSQRKRRDGLMRDSFKNAGKAFRKGSKEASKAPDEITRRFNTRRGWRMVRVVTPF